MAVINRATDVEVLAGIGEDKEGNGLPVIVSGSSGDDIFYAGADPEQFIGGPGHDTVSYLESNQALTIDLLSGEHSGIAAGDTYSEIETIQGSYYDDTFVANGDGTNFDGAGGNDDTVDYSASVEGVKIVVGSDGRSAGTGGSAEGSTLTDIERIIGSSFDDLFISHLQPDSYLVVNFAGGAGNDVYVADSLANVNIVEYADGGIDELRLLSSDPHGSVLAANVENFTYLGDGSFFGIGNESDNIIRGGQHDDMIDGGGGDDTLIGGDGADSFYGGDGYDTASYVDSATGLIFNFKTGEMSGIAAGDVFYVEAIRGSEFDDTFVNGAGFDYGLDFDGGAGVDTVDYSGLSYGGAGLYVEMRGGDSAAVRIGDFEGNRLSNVEIIIGTAANDTFISGPDAHGTLLTFAGGAGDDIYYVDGGVVPNIIEEAWDGIDEVRVSVGDPNGVVLADNVENLTFVGSDDFVGIGNDEMNVIKGGSGVDALYGMGGDDSITVSHGLADGGDGDDLLTGTGSGFSLFGGAGEDMLMLQGAGSADGGEGDDHYVVQSSELITIQDTGVSGADFLFLNIGNSQLLVDRVGDDLYLHSSNFAVGDTIQQGVVLKDWFAGYDSIEHLMTADNHRIYLTGQGTADFVVG